MSSVISGSMGVFVPFLVFAIMLFYYLHEMWMENAEESLSYLDKNKGNQPISIIGGGIDMYSARLQPSMPDGEVGGGRGIWLSSQP